MYLLNGTLHPKYAYPNVAVLEKCSALILCLLHQGTELVLHLSLITKNNTDTDDSGKYTETVAIYSY